MLKLKFILSCCFILCLGYAQAQESPKKAKKSKITTTNISVSGVCKMCKKRIEDAALIKGVKLVDWDKNTQELKVIFNNTKTKEETIVKAIVAVGHDTGTLKSSDETYKTLPDCCAYRDGVEVH